MSRFKYALHLLALPHTTLTDAHLTCAYSQKVRRACAMFRQQGHYVILYGPDKADVDCDEHVMIATEEDRKRWGFSDFDVVKSNFSWETDSPHFSEWCARAAVEVKKRAEPRDLLLLTTSAQSFVAQENFNLTVAEWTVGYEGAFERDRWFAAYESYAWMHHVAGLKGWRCPRPFDRVVPNFFDVKDFTFRNKKEDYLLFVGRLIERKGAHIACSLAERLGRKIILAGPGIVRHPCRKRADFALDIDGIKVKGDVEYVGEINKSERDELMGKAAAVIVPTIYLEPFGGVAVEAMLCGTPVVASDFGVFAETVIHGQTGYRFRTLEDGEIAFEKAIKLKPRNIRKYAVGRWSTNAVGPQFDEWFSALDTLWEENGFYAPRHSGARGIWPY